MKYTVACLLALGLINDVAAKVVDFGKYTCPLEGPKIPRPKNIMQSAAVQAAFKNITDQFLMSKNGTLNGGWSNVNASFSFAVVTHESPKPIWEYHYRGTGNVNGTKHVDGNTQYHIGSMSKLITTMAMKKSGIDMGSLITKWLPELNHPEAKIQWNKITLQMLADHLSGIPANFGFSEFYYLNDQFHQWGFPNISDTNYASCGVAGLNNQCTRKQILDGMKTLEPVTTPNRHVVYSQLSYILLSYALSNYVGGGKNYTQLLEEIVTKPLQMNNTGPPETRNSSNAVIPPVPNWWDTDHGETVPGGGLHSSSNDLSSMLYGLLSHTYMSEIDFFGWIKPTALTSSLYTLIGTPWELTRSYGLTEPDYPQIHDIYSKGGTARGYSSQVSLIEQYGLGMVWLTAGDTFTAVLTPGMMVDALFLPIEQETRRQATENYAYIYSNYDSKNPNRSLNGTDLVQLGLTLDQGPGLVVTNLTRGNHDILGEMGDIFMETFGQLGGIPMTVFPLVRMYPMDMYEHTTDAQGRKVVKEDWRIRWDPIYDPRKGTWKGSNLTGLNPDPDACGSWVATDWIHYGSVSIERIVLVRDEATDKVIGAELPWLRSSMAVDHTRPVKPWWSTNVSETTGFDPIGNQPKTPPHKRMLRPVNLGSPTNFMY